MYPSVEKNMERYIRLQTHQPVTGDEIDKCTGFQLSAAQHVASNMSTQEFYVRERQLAVVAKTNVLVPF